MLHRDDHGARGLPRFTMSRRQGITALAAAWLAGPAWADKQELAAALSPTSRDFEGPYRPLPGTAWGDSQLALETSAPSPGLPIRVGGRVVDTEGRPLPGLVVQLWQANATGRYNHPAETPGHGVPDPAFRGYGQTLTDATGCYAFQSIRPSGYRRTLFGFVPWRFVPHIHIAVRASDRDLLVTQIDVEREVAGERNAAASGVPALMNSAALKALPNPRGELLQFDIVLALAG